MEAQNVQYIIDHAEQHCSKHGSRLTNKRKQVLSELLHSQKALSAYELADIFKEKFGKTLPPMSIYRILDFLVKENLAHKLEIANKYVACEHISCNQPHKIPQFLICRICSKVKEISINKSTLDSLQNSTQEAGFKLISSQIELSCICDECINKDAAHSC